MAIMYLSRKFIEALLFFFSSIFTLSCIANPKHVKASSVAEPAAAPSKKLPCPYFGITHPSDRRIQILKKGDKGYADWKLPWNSDPIEDFSQPVGVNVTIKGKKYIQGIASIFGGKGDSGISGNETGGYGHHKLKTLTGYFCALRMNEGQKKEYAAQIEGSKILVRNPDTGLALVCDLEDWGPNPQKGDAKEVLIDLSPQAMRYIMGEAKPSNQYTDAYRPPNIQIAFANLNSVSGPVSGCF